jgi:hypothetical protein
MVRRLENCGKGFEVRLQQFDATWIEDAKGFFSLQQVQRRALSRTSFCQRKSAIAEDKAGQRARFGRFRSAFLPMKSAADHEMEDEPEMFFQPNSDALANAPQLKHLLTLHAADGRLGRPQKRDPGNLDPFEDSTKNPFLERFDVGGDVGQFRHWGLRSL